MEIEAFEGAAQRAVQDVDVEGFLSTYAAYPELAGPQMLELIRNLPVAPQSKSREKVDAFYALAILQRTHDQIMAVLREDEHMQTMLDQVHMEDVDITESLKGDEGFGTQAFREYLKNETGGDQRAVDESLRIDDGSNDDAVHRSFQEAMRGEEGARVPKKYDYSGLSPSEAFIQSSRQMGVLIVQASVARKRMAPLVTHRHRTREQIESLCCRIQFLISQLRYDEGGFERYEG